MNAEVQTKVTASHLQRKAYLYIRQSTLHQVLENTESTRRQYALRQRAVALGWPFEAIIVLDEDQAHSGASTAGREAFQRLVTEVSMGRAGIVLGLEVSRLARNSADWHRLLEICAVTSTLILDEDGIYDPAYFNDRMLLGLKGTLSEAELHFMRARMRGGLLNKAKRGDLVLPLPIGLVYDGEDRVVLDPDQQVQGTIRLFFETFRRTGAASAVVKTFEKDGIPFPRRATGRGVRSDLLWGKLELCQALHILRNPRYAGAFFYGRTRSRKKLEGGFSVIPLPRDQWHTLLVGAHPGYISWEEYERNQHILRDNALAYGTDHRMSPPREGPALLQGLLICGVCGYRMTVHYHRYARGLTPEYLCQRRTAVRNGENRCQAIGGTELDRAIGNLLLETLTPLALEVALNVQQEFQSRLEDADRLRRAQVDRAGYEADLARRRYMQVDPQNRLVADSLEADWNQRLRVLAEAKQEYERQRQTDQQMLTEQQRNQILALATDFPRLWRDPNTPARERKRMLRLLIEDVTVLKDRQITAHVRFKGGASKTLTLPLPANEIGQRKTSPEAVIEINRQLDRHGYRQIASMLNASGFLTGTGRPFDGLAVAQICRKHQLKNRYNRLREAGFLTSKEMAQKLDVCEKTIRQWRRNGLIHGYPCIDGNLYLYEAPRQDLPPKNKGSKLIQRLRNMKVVCARGQEVQYEA
jgi:DNA invertase Pin-like site-specific DNA recombinase